jgi:hypothetical protein
LSVIGDGESRWNAGILRWTGDILPPDWWRRLEAAAPAAWKAALPGLPITDNRQPH